MREYFYFLRLIRQELYGVVFGILMSFIATFSSVALMGTATWFLSAMAIAGFYDVALNIFIPSALIRLLALSRTILRYCERYYTHDATFRILAYLRVFLFERALDLKYEEALKLRSADLQRRMQADVERLEMIYVRQVAPFICAVLMGLVVGGVLLSFSALMALTALSLMVLAGVVVPVVLTQLSYRESQAQSTLAVKLNNQASTLLHGFFDLVLLDTHGKVASEFLEHSQQLAKVRSKLTFYEQLSQVALLTCSELVLVLLLIDGVPLVVSAEMSPSQLMLFAVAAMASFEVLVPLAAACLNLPYVMQAAQRLSELLQITERNSELAPASLKMLAADPIEANQSSSVNAQTQAVVSTIQGDAVATATATSVASAASVTAAEVKVELEHVSFAYTLDDGVALQVLNDFSLELSSHKNYLLKAPSGRGKSTLVLLLTALLAPQQGHIYLKTADGKKDDYALLPKRQLRQHFVVAMQDNTLFSGTIFEIFSQVKPKVKADEIMQVLDIVELRELFTELPLGLSTWIGSTGISLSGGQLRRLCVARALLKQDADFLILDEPGEGLDEAQEERILTRIQSQRKGVIIITHKNAGAQFSDCTITLGA